MPIENYNITIITIPILVDLQKSKKIYNLIALF